MIEAARVRGLFLCPSQLVNFGVLPAHVHRVIEVQQQAFFAVEEAEAEEVVVNESKPRANNDIDKTEAFLAISDRHLRTQRRVLVHVLNVAGEGGVGVVKEVTCERSNYAVNLDVFVNSSILETGLRTQYESEFAVRVEAAPSDYAS